MTITRIAIDAESDQGQLKLKFRVLSGGPLRPQHPIGIALDAPPLDAYVNLESDDQNNPPMVLEGAGRALYQMLDGHRNFQNSLIATLAAAEPAERRIDFEIPDFAPAAHAYPWEILSDGAFLTTEKDVCFTRTVHPLNRAASSEVVFDGDLRLASIIAAAGTVGWPEWEAVRNAILSYGSPVQTSVIVGNRALFDRIAEDAAKPANVALEMMPDRESDLLRLLDSASPHILHICCHGLATGLELETAQVELGGAPLVVTGASLASRLRSTWLVALNACSSGAPNLISHTNSIACQLVQSGVPIVTSMRQDVQALAASEFTGTFLTEVLAEIAGHSGSQRFTLEIGRAVNAARRDMAHRAAPNGLRRSKAWTLPIVCMLPDGIVITRPVGGATDHETGTTIAEIAALKNARDRIALTPDATAAIDARIAELSANLTAAGSMNGGVL